MSNGLGLVGFKAQVPDREQHLSFGQLTHGGPFVRKLLPVISIFYQGEYKTRKAVIGSN